MASVFLMKPPKKKKGTQSTLRCGPSPLLRHPGVLVPSLPPSLPPSFLPRPTSERRIASRVFLPYKSSSRGANRSTLISAIISDSNYLQIYQAGRENTAVLLDPKKQLWFHSSPISARNFYASKQEIFGDAPLSSVARLYLFWSDTVCTLLLSFGRLKEPDCFITRPSLSGEIIH